MLFIYLFILVRLWFIDRLENENRIIVCGILLVDKNSLVKILLISYWPLECTVVPKIATNSGEKESRSQWEL